jgi:LppP/LprE lipoprotein
MGVMQRHLIAALAVLVLGAGAGAALGGCGGSQTKTVTVVGGPAVTHSTPATGAPSAATTSTTGSAPTSTAGGTAAPATTRTASEPEFAQQEGHGEGLAGAVATVQARGYTPTETAQYHASQTLRVLVGTRTGSSDGYGQQAFFFVGGRFIGTDTKEPSATVKVISQGDTEVTLAYPLYRKGDPLSNPSGGQATVRFQLDNGKLTALDQIPPASSVTGTSRN